MRFIFILIIGLFSFQAPSANAADPAGLNAVSQEKKKKSKSNRIKVMSQELAMKMDKLNGKIAAKDYEGVITDARDHLSAKPDNIMDIFYMNLLMASAAVEMEKYTLAQERFLIAYETSKEMNPSLNRMIIFRLIKVSLHLEEYDRAFYWIEVFEESHGVDNPQHVVLKAHTLYHLGRMEEAKTVFQFIFEKLEPVEWRGLYYETMLKAAIQTQDRVYLLKLAKQIKGANVGVTIEEAITILEDENTPLDMSFAEKMKTGNFEIKNVVPLETPVLFNDDKKEGALILLSRFNHKYPEKAVRNKICGYVIAEYTVTKKGTVDKKKIIESKPRRIFDKAVKEALEQYIYKPREVKGKKVDTKSVKSKFTFELANGCKE